MDAEPGEAANSRGPPILAVCLFGPTGCGKTALALELVAEFALEIVSVDSAMVYRGMDIGTAKPSDADRAAVPHHLIDIREPWEAYSAGQFRQDAMRLIPEIHARGRTPLLVGGTMLYFRSLFRGLADLPAADAAVRAALDREAAERGWPAMHEELSRVDPVSAARIAPADRQRIQRALEVYRISGEPISGLQRVSDPAGDIRYLRLCLLPGDRGAHYQRLDRRLDEMIDAGLVDEVRRLRELPLMSAAVPAMRAVGYRQIWGHLAGDLTLQEATRQAAIATHRLAKRQLTWLRSEKADLELEALAADTRRRVAMALGQSGVSRRDERCNIMDRPLECRELGV